MLYRDYIEKLLELKDVIVTNIECQGRENAYMAQNGTTDTLLPCCGTITGKVHVTALNVKRYFHIRI